MAALMSKATAGVNGVWGLMGIELLLWLCCNGPSLRSLQSWVLESFDAFIVDLLFVHKVPKGEFSKRGKLGESHSTKG